MLALSFPHRRRLPVLAVLAALLLFGGAASTGIAPSADGDIWWHLAAGREMVLRGALLFSDPFSVSALGRPWVDVHWLFQLASYAVYCGFGLAGLVWAKCLIIGLSALLLLAALDGRAKSWARPLFVTLLVSALFVARSLLLARPVIVSLFFLALFFFELERFRRDGLRARLLIVLFAQLVWANFQGLSALGPALVGAYALSGALSLAFAKARFWPFAPEMALKMRGWHVVRAQLLAFAGSVLASFATPFGFRGLALSGKLLGRLLPAEGNVYARSVAENVPPFLLERSSGEFWHLKWCLAWLAVAFLCSGRRLRLSHVLLSGSLALLALMSNRNVLLLYWLGAPIAAGYLAPVARVWLRNQRRARQLVWSLNGAALLGVLCCSAAAAASEPPLDQPSPFRAPEGSARVLAGLPSNGAIFAADHQGGYLIWQLFPRFKPYIDSRLVLRTPQEFSEYLGLADEPQRFAAFQARHHFSYVVLPVAYPDRYLSLIVTLYSSSDWKLIFTNGSEVLFARSDLLTGAPVQLGDPQVNARILADIAGQFVGRPKLTAAAQLNLATLEIALGEVTQAESVLSSSKAPEAQALRARCRLGAGDLLGAKEIGERLLKQNRNDVSSLNLLAQVALRNGELAQSVKFLRRALGIDPFDGEASQLLAKLEEIR